MSEEDKTAIPKTDLHSDLGRQSGVDWAGLHRRLGASREALQQRSTPSPAEKQKILRARARLLAGEDKRMERRVQSLEVVEFILGSEHYGIELGYIREIHPLSEFTPLPCTPAFILGLVNVRGQILSIVDIKKLFDLPGQGLTDLNKVIIVRFNQLELGILADAIVGVRAVAIEGLHASLPTLTGIRAEYVKGITKDPLIVLEISNILSDEKIVVDEAVNKTR